MKPDLINEREYASNGIKVYSCTNEHLHTFSICCYIKAGLLYEDKSEQGITHLFEHMVFRNLKRTAIWTPSAHQARRKGFLSREIWCKPTLTSRCPLSCGSQPGSLAWTAAASQPGPQGAFCPPPIQPPLCSITCIECYLGGVLWALHVSPHLIPTTSP